MGQHGAGATTFNSKRMMSLCAMNVALDPVDVGALCVHGMMMQTHRIPHLIEQLRAPVLDFQCLPFSLSTWVVIPNMESVTFARKAS